MLTLNDHIRLLHGRMKYTTIKRIEHIFNCIKLEHIFNRTSSFRLRVFYICFVQQCIDEDTTTKNGQFVTTLYIGHDVRVKRKSYATNLTSFQGCFKSCRHLLMTDDLTFRLIMQTCTIGVKQHSLTHYFVIKCCNSN
jgi:hypothetical protein